MERHKRKAHPIERRLPIRQLFLLTYPASELTDSNEKVGSSFEGGVDYITIEPRKLNSTNLSKILEAQVEYYSRVDNNLSNIDILKLLIEKCEEYFEILSDNLYPADDYKLREKLKHWQWFLQNQVRVDEWRPETIIIRGKDHYDYMEMTGQLKDMEEKGLVIYPTHNFEMLKEKRQELFVRLLAEFKVNREKSFLKTTNQEIFLFKKRWLNNELKVIESWSEHQEKRTKPDAIILVELDKYQAYINDLIQKPEISEIEIQATNVFEQDEPDLLRKIRESFESLEPSLGWKAIFRSQQDFENLTLAIYQHFTKQQVTMPLEMKLVKRKKTKVASLLGSLHSKHSEAPIFKNDKIFFDIVRTISDFQNETDLVKTLKR